METALNSIKLTEDKQQTVVSRDPTAKFSKLSEKLRQITPDDLQCSVFCGGKKCKYESGTFWETKDMAIDGLFSHWVTDDILACARPNTISIDKYAIIDQFKRSNIKSLINLQCRGEHANCGNALHESGFSYNPQVFMKNDIFFYNFSVKDYGVASHDFVLDMVKVMAFTLKEGKVAVHCHAGLGRTGVLVACYLIYALRVQANDAITYLRLKRPNSIQTRSQILSIQDFSRFVAKSFVVFPHISGTENCMTLKEYVRRQNRLLHGYEARNLKYIPNIVYVICERLLHLSHCKLLEELHAATKVEDHGSTSTNKIHSFTPFWKTYLSSSSTIKDSYNSSMDSTNDESNSVKTLLARNGNIKSLKASTSPAMKRLSRGASSPALIQSPSPPAKSIADNVEKIFAKSLSSGSAGSQGEDFSTTPALSVCKSYSSWDQESSLSEEGSSLFNMPLDDNDSLYDVQEDANCSDVVGENSSCIKTSDLDVTQNACFKELLHQADVQRHLAKMDADGISPLLPPEDLAKVFTSLDYECCRFSEELRNKLQYYKVAEDLLNNKQIAWECLLRETDAQLLIALLISWFYALKRPILNDDEVETLINDKDEESIVDTLGKLSTACRFLVEYLVRFVYQLKPLSESTRNGLLDKIVVLLTYNDSAQCADYQSVKKSTLKFLKKFFDYLVGLGDHPIADSPINR